MEVTSIYQAFYDLIAENVFGGGQLASFQELVCTQVSTLACLFLVALPFLLIWRIIRML